MNATTSFSPLSPTETLRPSLAATLCGILAMVLLILTAGPRGWVLPFCAVALLATHFTSWRWPQNALAPVVLRLILFAALFLTANFRRINIDWIFQDYTLQFFGQLAAVELVLQHWRTGRGVRYPAISLLLSCTIFLAACNVRYGIVPRIVPFVTPIFWGCLLWALRDWKPSSQCRGKYLPTIFAVALWHSDGVVFLILTLVWWRALAPFGPDLSR